MAKFRAHSCIMCGICGFIRFKDRVDTGNLLHMADAVRHRGPDDEGYMVLNEQCLTSYSGKDSVAAVKQQYQPIQQQLSQLTNLGLGFRRLSIIDLSALGHQPMLTTDRQLALTFNGEIYNYKELRLQLEQAGLGFTSNTDTEVILLGYRHWGIDVIQKLNGMFAFALYDNIKQQLFIVRDRLGIKPLFYHHASDGITWASEIKSVLKAPWVKAEMNMAGLFANYQLQTTPSPRTCFNDIFSLEPGTYMQIALSSGKVELNKYWEIPLHRTQINITRQQAAEQLDDKLQQIVSMQLRSDVPVTSLMSGGIDSTTLTAICAQQHRDFHCYSLGFDGTGEGADELPQAIAMAKMLGIPHHVHRIHPADIVETLDASLRHFEEPYINLEPGYAASMYLHNEGYKVVMNGLGADEVFGGYPHYLHYQKWEQRKKMFFLEALVPTKGDYFRKVKNYFNLDTTLKYFINSRLGMRPHDIEDIYSAPFTPAGNLLSEDDKQISYTPEALFYYDLKYYIGSHHVYRDDLSGMAHSIEMRYPYLDHELIEWVATLPMHIRYDGVTTKPLLREVARKYIMPVNLSMAKKGFNLPLDEWMKEDNSIQDYAKLKLDSLKKRQLFNNATIDKWWRQRHQGAYFSRLWQLVTTEVWLEEYFN